MDKFIFRSQRTYNAATVQDGEREADGVCFHVAAETDSKSSAHHATLKIEVVLFQAA